jgi:hypothetical protein
MVRRDCDCWDHSSLLLACFHLDHNHSSVISKALRRCALSRIRASALSRILTCS